MKKSPIFIIIMLVQIALLSAMVLNSYAVIFWGEKVLLKVEPVDPRSLFQGDYVRLGYSFSNLDLSKVANDLDLLTAEYQEKVYLVLEERDQTWEVVFASQDKAKVSGQIYLEGKILYTSPGNLNTLQLKLPIEQFYLPEGKGLEIEERIKDGEIYAQVAVYKGKARVVDLIE